MWDLSRIAPTGDEERHAKFYWDLAEDARMLAARLQDEEARSTIFEVAAAFARIAATLEGERRGADALDAFVAEGNVELYLSKAYQSLEAEERDRLLRLVVEEEATMGHRREHRDNGQRRLNDCEQRVQRQRELVHALRQQGHDTSTAHFVLETYERTLVLLRGHQQLLVERFQQARL